MLRLRLRRLVHFAPRAGITLHGLVGRDLDAGTVDVVRRVKPYTLTNPPRIASLCASVEYIVRHRIAGAFVECGVWRGGSMMAVALTLQRLGVTDRDLYLFDTYEGMTKPTEVDVDAYSGQRMLSTWRKGEELAVPVADVRRAMETTGYPMSRVHLVVGPVEETVPENAPETIALLRLDTDWYESTLHELVHLYPRLSQSGVLMIDDYGYFEGTRRAVDEYFEKTGAMILLNRVDGAARIAVKQEASDS